MNSTVIGAPSMSTSEDPESGCNRTIHGECTYDFAIAAALQAEEDRRSAQALEHFHQGSSGPGSPDIIPPDIIPQQDANTSRSQGLLPKNRCHCIIIAIFVLLFTTVVGAIFKLAFFWDNSEDYDLGNFREISRGAFDHTNEYRASKGKVALSWNDGIAAIAAEHAEQMATNKAPFSHDGLKDRVDKYPVEILKAGENLALCGGRHDTDIAACAVDGWINSPDHEENLVRDWTLCGIGTARSAESGTFYLTQLFAQSQSCMRYTFSWIRVCGFVIIMHCTLCSVHMHVN